MVMTWCLPEEKRDECLLWFKNLLMHHARAERRDDVDWSGLVRRIWDEMTIDERIDLYTRYLKQLDESTSDNLH